MPLAQNGRGIRGLVWTDSDGQPHTILLAYLGDKVVWDGHIHETIQVPAMVGASTLPVPVVGSASLVEVPLLSALADLPAPALVGGGVTVSPDEMSVDAVAFVPVLHSDHTLDIEVPVAVCEMPAPDIRVVFGVTPESMTAAAVLHAPAVFASALVSPPEMVAFVEVRNPDVGSWAIIEPPVMAASVVGPTPGVAASSRVDGEVATGTALHPVPTLAAGSAVVAPTSLATAGMQVPEIHAAAPPTFDAAATAGGSTSTVTASLTTQASTVIVAHALNGSTSTGVTIDGSPMELVGSASSIALYQLAVGAGSHTIVASRTSGSHSIVAASYVGVTTVSGAATGSGTGTVSVLPSGTGSLAVVGARTINGSPYTSSGTVRGFDAGSSGSRSVLADGLAAPVTITPSSSGGWDAVTAWLT